MHAIARFEAVRRLLGQEHVLALADLDEITCLDPIEAFEHYANQLYRLHQLSVEDILYTPGPQWPEVKYRELIVRLRMKSTTIQVVSGEQELVLTYTRPYNPFSAYSEWDMAMLWLADDQNLPIVGLNGAPELDVLMKVVAQLCWIGLTDEQIAEHGQRLRCSQTLTDIWGQIDKARLREAERHHHLLQDAWEVRHPEDKLPRDLRIQRVLYSEPLFGHGKRNIRRKG